MNTAADSGQPLIAYPVRPRFLPSWRGGNVGLRTKSSIDMAEAACCVTARVKRRPQAVD